MRLEDLLRDALYAGAMQVREGPDLFDRVKGSMEDDARRRAWRRRVATIGAAALTAFSAPLIAVSDVREGELLMDWWILEIVTTAILVTIMVLLGPFIKRFGRSYAADVFRSNPGTGKSFIILIDFAYYLIFGAYVLMTVVFERPKDWGPFVNAAQLKIELVKVAGMLLLMGVLHGFNLFALPVVGRLLTLNRQLDLQMREWDRHQEGEGGKP